MARLEDRTHLYDVANRFITAALKNDDSMFTPGKAVWAPEPIEEIYQRYVVGIDESDRPFDVKLREQLDGASDVTIQLAAEVLFLALVIPTDMGGEAKRSLLDVALSMMTDRVAIPEELDSMLDRPAIARIGTGHIHRYFQTAYLIELVRHWKPLDGDEQARLLSDPWLFKEFETSVEVPKAAVLRNGILHLIFPDSFEPMTADNHKRLIANHYKHLINGNSSSDVDRHLLAIREALGDDAASGRYFYDPLVRPGWDPNASMWDKFIYWAAKLHSSPDYDERERKPKFQAIKQVRDARNAFLAGDPDWPDVLRRSFSLPYPLTSWRVTGDFNDWCRRHPEQASPALHAVWDFSLGRPERVEGFLNHLPREVASGPSARLSLLTFLLINDDDGDYAMYRSAPFNKAFELTGTPFSPNTASDAERYFHALEFLDQILSKAASRGLHLRDRMDAQSIVWAVTRWGPQDDWPQVERDSFNAFLAGKVLSFRDEDDDDDNGGQPEPPIPGSPQGETAVVESLNSLADRLMLPVEHLRKIERLLEYKRQAIFYGPPGTGKTYVARELADYFAQGGGAVDIVQFHPSYAYEDFIEGLRPVEVGGETRFRVVDGPLKRIAAEARQNPDAPHVLLIDEINRGNLSKVLGELYFLLEYRNHPITLQYSRDEFALPDNLWIIGTMNTADRSIALVDAALRRRFFFVGFFPDEEPIDGLLRRWLARNNPDYLWVADVVDEANRRLDDRHLAIGPSYFMKDDLDEEWLEIIWEHQVIPYLAEQFFGEEARLDEFHLKNLRRQQVTELPEEPDTTGE